MTNGTILPKKITNLTTEFKKINKQLEYTGLLLANLHARIHGKPLKIFSKKSNNPINASGTIGQKLTEQKMDTLSSFVYQSQYQYKFVGKEQVSLAKKSTRIDLFVTSVITGKTIHFEVKHQDVGGTASKSIFETVRVHKCIKKHVLLVVSGEFYTEARIAEINTSFLVNDDNEAEFSYMVHLNNLEKVLSYWDNQSETNLLDLAILMNN